VIQAGIGTEDTDGAAGLQFGPGLFQNRGRAAQWLHLGLGRGELATSNTDFALTGAFQNLATATITPGGAAGGTGFVLVTADATAWMTGSDAGGSRRLEFQIVRGAGGTSSSVWETIMPTGTGAVASSVNAAQSWAFTVPTGGGPETFTLQGRIAAGTVSAVNVRSRSITALYVPFGGTGGNVLSAPAAVQSEEQPPER